MAHGEALCILLEYELLMTRFSGCSAATSGLNGAVSPHARGEQAGSRAHPARLCETKVIDTRRIMPDKNILSKVSLSFATHNFIKKKIRGRLY